MLTGPYLELYQHLQGVIPEGRLIHDPLRTLAYGTDASFYRLVPKLVVKVDSESEVVAVLRACYDLKLPLTFRAAGTSLSGQAVSDSVLVMLGTGWRWAWAEREGAILVAQPGVVGAHANRVLAPYGRKIGPDPASINSAMIGGIAANNASGMCCGTAQNSYRTLAGLRMVFLDGSVLDTSDPASRAAFCKTHKETLLKIKALSERVKDNAPLAERIRHKFKMKNTTGYSLNALIDFDDPIDILAHLMIGSEGTLAFLSQIRYHTVPEWPFKASALMLFPDVYTACRAVTVLKEQAVDAVELMDRAALRSVEDKPGMPPVIKTLPPEAAALLVETRAPDASSLQAQIGAVTEALASLELLKPIRFTADPLEYSLYWNIRKGLFPALSVMRQVGTTVIIEDVTFPTGRLAEATLDLQALFKKHAYHEAIIFGHALDGNLHFVFNQDFSSDSEVRRYEAFMDEVCHLVVGKYDGALKAEHGTGRNMAPFVALEWGEEAHALMREIKAIFDPHMLLNPGVILNDDPKAHLKDLKPMPQAHEIIDMCIECGFCEINCPSKDLTLTPRQRITVFREMQRLRRAGDTERLRTLEQGYAYQGDATCATDGLCAIACPVNIDTGTLIKDLRAQSTAPSSRRLADLIARNMRGVVGGGRAVLTVADAAHALLGTNAMGALATGMRRLSGGRIPQWNPYLPKGAPAPRASQNGGERVVYAPSCISRLLGVSRGSGERDAQIRIVETLLARAGYSTLHPDGLSGLCCGMAFSSKGYTAQGDAKRKEMRQALFDASRGGNDPVLMDTSPCFYHLQGLKEPALKLYEPVSFSHAFLLHRLALQKLPETVAIHTTCTNRKLGLGTELQRLASACAETVIAPEMVGCCGFAGDRGFNVPELTISALTHLPESLPGDCEEGFSTGRTCEIGLSMASGVHYKSIFYLLERASRNGAAVY